MREKTLLGTGLFLVTAGATDTGIKLVLFYSIQQSGGLQAIATGIITLLLLHAPLVNTLLHGADHQPGIQLFHQGIAIVQRLLEIVPCVDMQQGERNLGRIEGLVCQIGNHNGVFAAGEKYGRPLELRRHLSQDVDGLRFQFFQMSEFIHCYSIVFIIKLLFSSTNQEKAPERYFCVSSC